MSTNTTNFTMTCEEDSENLACIDNIKVLSFFAILLEIFYSILLALTIRNWYSIEKRNFVGKRMRLAQF